MGRMEKIHCATTPCWRAKELQEMETAMTAAKGEGKRPSGKNILLPVHGVPGPEKELWCQWQRDLCALIMALQDASLWQPHNPLIPLKLLSFKTPVPPVLSLRACFLKKMNYPRN